MAGEIINVWAEVWFSYLEFYFLLQDYVIQGDAAAAPAANNQNEAAPNNPPPAPPPQPQGAGLGAAHQAMLQGGGPVGFQSYKRPRLFYFRVKKNY